MRLHSARRRSADEDNPYWMSFSDIMSALLVIFILASLVLIMELIQTRTAISQAIVELQQADQIRRTILEEAKAELEERNIRVEISENQDVLHIPNELLGFDTGQYQLETLYHETAREIGQVLKAVISKDDRIAYLDTIFVEGHTDDRTYAGLMGTGNWGLSTFRAISLWRFWEETLPQEEDLSNLRNKNEQPLFSVSGYGESRPLTEQQETEEEYRLNRRIDIRITIRHPDIRDYQSVINMAGSQP